jgi:DNA-binding LytR/AlgR family response regulator
MLIAGGWVALGVVGAVLEGLVAGGGRLRPSPALPLAGLLWVPLTFAAAALTHRIPWEEGRRVRFVLAHGAAACAATYVLNGAFFAIALLVRAVPPDAVVPATLAVGTRWLHLHAAAWAVVVGLVHVTDGRLPGPGESAEASTEGSLTVSRGRGGLQLPWSEIDWIEADGDYARVHAGGRAHLVSARMKALERELPRARFVRVHRSAIINVGRVREVRHRSHGDFEAELLDGTVVRVSRTRREALLACWGSET